MTLPTEVRELEETETVYGEELSSRTVYIAHLTEDGEWPSQKDSGLFMTDYDEDFKGDSNSFRYDFWTPQKLGATDEEGTFLHSVVEEYGLSEENPSVFLGINPNDPKNYPTSLERAETDDNGVPEDCYLFHFELDDMEIDWFKMPHGNMASVAGPEYDRETYREVFDATDGKEVDGKSFDRMLDEAEKAFEEEHGIQL